MKTPKPEGITTPQVYDPAKIADSIPPYAKKPIRTAKDAKKMLGKLIHAFQRHEVEGDFAKTLTYLITSFVQICKDTEFEQRLVTLEKITRKKGELREFRKSA